MSSRSKPTDDFDDTVMFKVIKTILFGQKPQQNRMFGSGWFKLEEL